jgi:uncharacterized protein YdhG (YjbR/CyaY superfamily)
MKKKPYIVYETVEEFLRDLPADERAMCEMLRRIVFSNIPDAVEKFSYGVPYYFRYSRIVCIWPHSVWGGPKKGVFLGICRGHLLSNEQGLIEMGNRKEFGLIRFTDVKDLNETALSEIIQEAVMIDEEIGKKKIPQRKKFRYGD